MHEVIVLGLASLVSFIAHFMGPHFALMEVLGERKKKRKKKHNIYIPNSVPYLQTVENGIIPIRTN